MSGAARAGPRGAIGGLALGGGQVPFPGDQLLLIPGSIMAMETCRASLAKPLDFVLLVLFQSLVFVSVSNF